MRTLLISAFLLIAIFSFASDPIYLESKVFKSWSLNKNFSLTVIPQDSQNCYDWEPFPSAIAFVKKRGEKEPLYFFKVTYDNWSDYIISESGEIVLQIFSVKFDYVKETDGTEKFDVPYTEINVYKNGLLEKKITLDFAFCTYSTKTKYQNPVLKISDTKYFNLVFDTLYVISDTLIHKICITNGQTCLETEDVKLNSYKYKWLKTRSKHLKKYKNYDDKLNAKTVN